MATSSSMFHLTERIIQSHVFIDEIIEVSISSSNNNNNANTLQLFNKALGKYERIISSLEKDINTLDRTTLNKWETNIQNNADKMALQMANLKEDTLRIQQSVNTNSINKLKKLKNIQNHQITGQLYSLAIKLGKKSMQALMNGEIKSAIPSFLAFKKLLLETINFMLIPMKTNNKKDNNLNISLNNMYLALEKKIHTHIFKILDTWCMKIVTQAETIGDDILEQFSPKPFSNNDVNNNNNNTIFSDSLAAPRDNTWLQKERRQWQQKLNTSTIKGNNNNNNRSKNNKEINLSDNNNNSAYNFHQEIIELQIYFDCCSTIGTRSNAFKEFLLRTERVLRDMSPIFLFTFDTGDSNNMPSYIKEPTNMLKIIQNACKNYSFYFSLMDNIFRHFRFTVPEDHLNIYEQWKMCEEKLSSFLYINLKHLQENGNGQQHGTNMFQNLDFKLLKRLKKHVFSLASCIKNLKFVHFYEKIDGLVSNRVSFSSTSSPRNSNSNHHINRPFYQKHEMYKASLLLKTQFYKFQEMIVSTGFKSLRLGTDIILNQSSDGGGMHVSNIEEFEVLILPFGLIEMDETNNIKNEDLNKDDNNNDDDDNNNNNNNNNKEYKNGNTSTNKHNYRKNNNEFEFPLILPFSKRLSEFSILLQQFHFDISAFHFNRNMINRNLTLLLWNATFKIFDHCYLNFKTCFRNTKNRMETSLSLISQSSVDADYFSKIINHFCFKNIKLPEFNLMNQISYDKKQKLANNTLSLEAGTSINEAKQLKDKLEKKIREFKVLSSNLQDELVQILCEKTKDLTENILSKVDFNAKHRSNSVLSEFRVLIDFLATSYVNLMNLPKAKRESALYLSIAHVKASMLDTLMPYLDGDDDQFKVSMPGIFNITLAITSLENFAMEQGVDDLEQIFIPVRDFVKDLENNLLRG